MTGLFGGAFDPPHNGHVVLARKGASHFGLDPLVVLVNAAPGHKQVATPAEARLLTGGRDRPKVTVAGGG